MKPYILLVTILISTSNIFISCNRNDTKNNITLPVINDSTTKSTNKAKENKKHVDTVPIISRNQIIGIWATTDKEILTVDISKDSIFYTEHYESHKYELKNDSIYIHYFDFIYSGKPYLINDSLIFASLDGEAKYIRIKK